LLWIDLGFSLILEATLEPPQNPAGAFVPEERLDPGRRSELIAEVEAVPATLGALVAGLGNEHLEQKYRNWTVRQIVHHLADSHINAYARFKWALTEDHPTIKPYDESRWADLEDARTGDIRASLLVLEGVHARWGTLLRSMTEGQFARTFFHPEAGKDVSLDLALAEYAWHGGHHAAQVAWVREHRIGVTGDRG